MVRTEIVNVFLVDAEVDKQPLGLGHLFKRLFQIPFAVSPIQKLQILSWFGRWKKQPLKFHCMFRKDCMVFIFRWQETKVIETFIFKLKHINKAQEFMKLNTRFRTHMCVQWTWKTVCSSGRQREICKLPSCNCWPPPCCSEERPLH